LGFLLAAVLFVVGLVIGWTLLVRLDLFSATRVFCPRPSAPPAIALTAEATDLHHRLRIADLHCDATIWRKDLTRRSNLGHFDFPRMRDANGALQLFLSVTEIPRQVAGDLIDDHSDRLTLLDILDQWPIAAILDQTERALCMGSKLKSFCARSEGEIRFIEKASQLRRALDDRRGDPAVRAAVLGLESNDGTKYSLPNIQRLFAGGYRTCSLCHLADSAFAASASSVSKSGLTPLGRDAVAAMNEAGMIIDLAYVAPRVIEEVVKSSKRAPFVSHTGPRGVSNDPKCMSDELLRAVVEKGGVIGLCFVRDYVNGDGLEDLLCCIEHMI